MTDDHAFDFYSLVGIIAGKNLPTTEAQETELARAIIAAGYRIETDAVRRWGADA